MNYEEMSDYEINMSVVRVRGLTVQMVTDECIFVCDDSYEGFSTFNPCRKASDAWPIIVENKISLQWVGTYWSVLPPLGSKGRGINAKDPLRAAMIVYLMMQEEK